MDGSIVFARWRRCAPSSNTCFLGPTRVHIRNSILIGSDVFAQLAAEGPVLYNGQPLPLSNLLFRMRDLHSHLTRGSLGSPPSPQPKLHLELFSSFAGLTIVTDTQTDRQTDHLTPSVTLGPIYLRSTAMQPRISNIITQ